MAVPESEKNIDSVRDKIVEACKEYFGSGIQTEPFFEDGHWWVKATSVNTGESVFDVVDEDPGLNGTGLNFEFAY